MQMGTGEIWFSSSRFWLLGATGCRVLSGFLLSMKAGATAGNPACPLRLLPAASSMSYLHGALWFLAFISIFCYRPCPRHIISPSAREANYVVFQHPVVCARAPSHRHPCLRRKDSEGPWVREPGPPAGSRRIHDNAGKIRLSSSPLSRGC
jgi:hypothetical protein